MLPPHKVYTGTKCYCARSMVAWLVASTPRLGLCRVPYVLLRTVCIP